MGPSVGASIALKIGKNGLEVRKGMAPQSRGAHFYRFFFWTFIAYFQTPQKIFNYFLVAFRVTRLFWNLKMAISKYFKSLNLNKKMTKLCTDEVGGIKMKKKKKMHFIIWKNVFSLLLFFGCSFGFAFQRWFVELGKGLL